MVRPFFVVIILLLINSCGQKEATQSSQETVAQKNSFFPVTAYLLGQIRILDSLPVTPLKIITAHGKIDSTWLKRENIRTFVQPFLEPVIDSATLSGYFKENSFLDQSVNAFTFSYDPVKPLPDSAVIRRWDIYIDPESNQVTRVYIVKQANTRPKQTVQLTWKSGYSCKITTITEPDNGSPEVNEQDLVWNFND